MRRTRGTGGTRSTGVGVGVTIAVTVAALLLGGCAAAGPAAHRADATQALGSVAESVDAASSAVATATLVTDLWEAGDLPAVTADAALGDAVDAADAATHELATVVVPDAAVLALRDESLTAAQEATRSVAATRTWVGGGLPDAGPASGDDVRRALLDTGSRLAEVSRTVDEAAGQAGG